MDIKNVTETISMIEEQNFDIRTITMGISLLDCIDPDISKACDKIYAKSVSLASEVVGEKAKGAKRKRRTPAQMAEARALEAAQKGKKRSRTRAKKAPAKAEQPAPIVAPEIA